MPVFQILFKPLTFYFLPLLCFLFSSQLKAQNHCTEKFKAYNAQGKEVNIFCVGETIRYKSCATNAQPDKEYYDSNKNDGLAFPDTTKSFTYSSPGNYTVTQLINTGLPGNNQFERTFTVLPTPVPEILTFSCAFNKINLKITDSNYDSYRVNFGDGVERRVLPGKDTIYQYKNAGTYQLIVKAAYRTATCVVENSVSVQTLPALIFPEIQSLQITNDGISKGSLELQVRNLQPEYNYVVERAPVGSTNFQEIQKITSVPTTGNITILNTDTRTAYQYRLQATDNCGTQTGFYSPVMVSQPINISTAEKSLRISWQPYPITNEVINYQIYRDSKLLQTLPSTTTAYLDVAVACGRQYCYQVVAQLSNNQSSTSNDSCQVVTATVPPKPGLALASFNAENQVELTLQIPANETLSDINWQKKTNNDPFTKLTQVKQATYIDKTSFSENIQPCYQATYTDSCGLTTAMSNQTCPVILKSTFNAAESKVNLNWSSFVGFSTAPRYTVEVSDDATGQLLGSYPTGSNITFTDTKLNTASQILAYRIKVTTTNSPVVSYSNKIRVTQAFSATIPTAFSPNNDGLNDVFEVKGRFIHSVILKIYNRWGQVIFESKSPNEGWNGKINGQDAPVGTYIFSFTAQDLDGNTIQRKGSVTLVK
ncbi:MAG: gliding motility-associated C-terminal domain-containing protein [Bacteroidota bacterium]|nr:gliding motility-associated C-terminal domain-containing protein [Bacteroidota bacterium]